MTFQISKRNQQILERSQYSLISSYSCHWKLHICHSLPPNRFFQKVQEVKDQKKIDREIIHQLLKTLLSRLGNIPYPEQSEEMRLLCLNSIEKCIQLFPYEIVPLVSDIGSGLSKALLDSFPDGQKKACTLVMEAAVSLRSHIGHHALNIVKSLGNNVGHQHFKVRKISIQALVCILLTEGAGPLFEHVVNVFKGSANDQILEVRKTLYQAVAKLLNGFSIANLRSFESELVLILINGLSDESPDIINLCMQLIEDCGQHRKKLDDEMQGENAMQEEPQSN